jgi:hypothetical protein
MSNPCYVQPSVSSRVVPLLSFHLSSARLANTKAIELKSQNWKGKTSNGSDVKLSSTASLSRQRLQSGLTSMIRRALATVVFVPSRLKMLNFAVHINHVDSSARTHYG